MEGRQQVQIRVHLYHDARDRVCGGGERVTKRTEQKAGVGIAEWRVTAPPWAKIIFHKKEPSPIGNGAHVAKNAKSREGELMGERIQNSGRC